MITFILKVRYRKVVNLTTNQLTFHVGGIKK